MKKPRKVAPLAKSIVKDRTAAKKVLKAVNDKINKRIDYILNTIAKLFGEKVSCWYFTDAPEDSHGEITFDGHSVLPEIYTTATGSNFTEGEVILLNKHKHEEKRTGLYL